MKVYQIDYDLRKQKNYEALHERIRSYGTYCNPLKSSWLIATNQTAIQVRDYLRAVMDSDDGLLVTNVQAEAAWYGLEGNGISNWLQTQGWICTV